MLWGSLPKLKKEGVYLPYPIHDLRADCTCPDSEAFCKHIIAVVIYWIIDKDKRLLEKTPAANIIDKKTQFAMHAYQEKINAFRRLSGQKLPSFTRFHHKSLITAPDIHNSIQKMSHEVMRWAKNKT
ncbi:SWIM zinc finger family protein [Terrilactibacillus sp. S3-3]|nr:SWIM zinc finger family protein [Terrilactibacillus sp. S3-3]